MAPEYGATAAMFYIDEQTIKYLKLTGRDDELVKLVETYAKHTGLWADTLVRRRVRARAAGSTCRSVVRNMAGPSNPHKRVPTSDLAARGIAARWTNEPGRMPDGAVIIAAITSCTNTNNPRNMIAAGLLARNANRRGLHAQALGEEFAGAGFQGRGAVPRRSRPAAGTRAARVSASSRLPARPATACRARSIR